MKYLVVLLLAGCAAQAEYRWMRGSSSEAEFNQDSAACKAQALAVPGSYNNTLQFAMVYSQCLQGRGWQNQRVN